MINKERIDKIKAEFFGKGIDISTTNIGFAVLSIVMGDELAYEAIFGGAVMGDYARSERIAKLKEKVADYIGGDSIVVGGGAKADITFEENKAYVIELRQRTEQAMQDGVLDTKDGLTILKDLSVKLNDKFNVADKTINQVVVVNQKYSSVCEYCHHEIAPYPISKEEAMRIYGLVEKNKK